MRKNISLFSSGLMVIIGLLLSFSGTQAASAATIKVDTTVDAFDGSDGHCSVHEALKAAENDLDYNECLGAGAYGADTIQLMPGTYDISPNGELVITTDVTFMGDTNNVAGYVVHGNNAVRVFNVKNGGILTLQGFEIAKGYSSASGAGILNDGELSLDHMHLLANRTDDDGGAIHNTANGVIDHITFSQINSNTANLDNTSPDFDAGGGILNEGTIQQIDHTDISNNVLLDGAGGAILNMNGATIGTISNSTINNNQGGGIYNYESTISLIQATTFSGNTDDWDGGFLNVGLTNPATATLSNVTITGNTTTGAFGSGAGIYKYGPGDVTINDSFITDNHALGANTAGNGGGIYNGGSNSGTIAGILTINNTDISNNSAFGDGGAIYNAHLNPTPSESSQLVLNNVTLNGNTTGKHGGAISQGGYATLKNVTMSNNQAGGGGGGILNRQGVLTADQVNFDHNTSVTEEGGGIYNFAGATATINDFNFFKNTTQNINGGAMYNNGKLDLTSGTISSNSAGTANGGGIYNNNQGKINTLTGVTINNNDANLGGGIYNKGNIVSLSNTTIADNAATQDGAGLYNTTASASMPLVRNVTFDSNNAGNFGSQIYNDNGSGATLNLFNSIISTRVAGAAPNCKGTFQQSLGNLQFGDNSCSNITVAGSDPFGGRQLATNSNAKTQTLRLDATSEAIDAGNPSHCETVDQIGTVRPVDGNFDGTGVCDIGAYEYNNGTQTTLSSSLNPATANSNFNLIATVKTMAGNASGTIIFSDANGQIGTASLNNGVATLTIAFSAGTRNLTAQFAGDSFFDASSSSPLVQVVNAASAGGSGGGSGGQPPVSPNVPAVPAGGGGNVDQGGNPVGGGAGNVDAQGNPIFTDIDGHWAEDAILKLKTSCGVNGYSDASGKLLNLFKPELNITRYELITMLMKCKYGELPALTSADASKLFSDVAFDHWSAQYVLKAKETGVVEGYKGNMFLGDNNSSRAEALKMALLTFKTQAEVDGAAAQTVCTDATTGWYKNYFNYALANSVLGGYKDASGKLTGECGPNNFVTRAETAKVLMNTK